MHKSVFFLPLVYFLISSCIDKNDLFPFTEDFKPVLAQTAIDKCLADNPGVSSTSCDIKNCFASPVTLLALKELLIEVDKALKKVGVKYWVDSGSAIGAYRHFLLPWDDDVDLGVIKEDFTPAKRELLKKELVRQGFSFGPLTSPSWLQSATGVEGVWQVSLGKARFLALVNRYKPDINPIDADNLWESYDLQNRLYPSLDIFEFIEVEPGKYTYAAKTLATNQWKNKLIDKDKLVGSKTVSIFGKDYPGIEDEKEYFKVAYHTDDILHDFVIFQDHKPRCEKLRLKDIRKHPEMLEYMFSYLSYVFGSDFDLTRAKARFNLK
jgi:hypothetical protein